MACNKIVLGGVGGEAKRLIEEARAGFTFAPNDEKQLSDLILKTLDEIDSTSPTAVHSFDFIKNNYEAIKMNRIIETLVLEVV